MPPSPFRREPGPLLSPHHDYMAVSADPVLRQRRYREMVMATVDAEVVDAIRRRLQRQHPYGSKRFRQAIEAQLGRTVGAQKIGRPRKNAEDVLKSRL